MITSPLRITTQRFGNQPAIITADKTLSYFDYYDAVKSTAAALQSEGFNQGSRIAVLAQNSLEMIILLNAMAHTEITAVLVNSRFPDEAVALLMKEMDCSALIADKPYQNCGIPCHEMVAFTSVLDAGDKLNIDELNPDFPATIISSSGSMGNPRAIVHTVSNHFFNAIGSNGNISFQPADVWMLTLPLYHVGGYSLIWRAMTGGGAISIPKPGEPLEQSLNNLQASHISLVATQLQRTLELEESIMHLRGMKAVLVGGSGIPFALINNTVRQGIPILTTYGSTETSSQACTTAMGGNVSRLKTSGRELSFSKIKIADNGEIRIKGKIVCAGYFKDGIVRPLTDDDGWYNTGDIGSIDSDGYLTVKGRLDRMFISGGENIQPELIEKVLNEINGIKNSVVVPISDKEFIQRPAAFINGEWSESILKEKLKKNLPNFMIPDHFFNWPNDILKNSIKPNLQQLAKIAEEQAL